MNAFDIMEALTDMDDNLLMKMEMDPPRRKKTFLPKLRHLAVACLVVSLVWLALMAFDVNAWDTALRWTIRVQEERFTYIFWNRSAPDAPIPQYEPAWIPEEYELHLRCQFDEASRGIIYCRPEAQWDTIWFTCSYVGTGFQHSYSYADDAYTVKKVEVNGVEADCYYLTEYGGGILVWIDVEQQIMFSLRFDCDDESALRVAESITLIKGD